MSSHDVVGKGSKISGHGSGGRELLRDQSRALQAYEAVGKVPEKARKDYKIAVNDLGANILRSGLCAALAALERKKDGRGGILLDQLANAAVPGLQGATGDDIADRVRRLEADDYMIATREVLHVAAWLKRAAQATFGDD